MVVARTERLSYRHPDAPRPALDGVDLELAAGELVLLAGASGSGKTTLLRALCGLVPHFHGGTMRGRCIVDGLDTRSASPAEICRRAGLVFQDPEAGAVMLSVDREVAFPLQNAGLPAAAIPAMAERALAAAGALGLAGRRLATLSGGELQRVTLATALAPSPPLLLLDEPTSQLDPEGADALAAHLRRLCDETGTAAIVADHRTERLAAVADRVIVLERGRIVADGRPDAVELPPPSPPPLSDAVSGGAPLAILEDVAAGYGTCPVLQGSSLELREGTVTALAGRNGSGKTTLARVLAGLHRPSVGRIELCGADVSAEPAERRLPRLGYVGQDPGRYLLHETVAAEVAFALRLAGAHDEDARVAAALAAAGLTGAAHVHPRDLSGGERERVALASVLVADPRVVVLDEPTRGMDAAARAALVQCLRVHAAAGGACLVVTHDEGFAAAVADRRLSMEDGAPVPLAEAVAAS